MKLGSSLMIPKKSIKLECWKKFVINRMPTEQKEKGPPSGFNNSREETELI